MPSIKVEQAVLIEQMVLDTADVAGLDSNVSL